MLDNNAGLIAFQNGIYDIKNNTFRVGLKSTDYITDYIRYDYDKSKIDIEKTNKVKKTLKEIMNNNEEHLEYYLSVLGYCFTGCAEIQKSIYCCIDGTDGLGDNGKTFFFNILTNLMPCYVYKTKCCLIEAGNSKVHKQLCMMKSSRIVWNDEASKKPKNYELLKEFADGGHIENEVMFGTSEPINIMFKLFILSNHMMNFDAEEGGIYNRFKQLTFNSHFDRTGKIRACPDELQFEAGETLSRTFINEYQLEIIGLMVDYAHKFYENGEKLPAVPEQFLQDVSKTKAKNDRYGE
jgi:phage/plasmid-associated DNA primase